MTTRLTTMAVVALCALAPAVQAQTQPGSKDASGQTPSASAQRQLQAFTATITGPVTAIDKDKGKLTLGTPEGPLTIRLSPDALGKLTNLKQGDQASFGIGFIEKPQGAAASPKTEPPASGTSAQSNKSPSQSTSTSSQGQLSVSRAVVALVGTIEGEVASVDAEKGKLSLKTEDGPVTFNFPSMALQSLKQGDRLAVGVALVERR